MQTLRRVVVTGAVDVTALFAITLSVFAVPSAGSGGKNGQLGRYEFGGNEMVVDALLTSGRRTASDVRFRKSSSGIKCDLSVVEADQRVVRAGVSGEASPRVRLYLPSNGSHEPLDVAGFSVKL